MKFFDWTKKPKTEVDELKQRVDLGNDVEQMVATPGWRAVATLFEEQREAYVMDNATNAKDWENYLDKRAKIFALNLLLTDIQDFIRQGEEASKELDTLKDKNLNF